MPRIDPPPQYKGDRGPRGFGFILSEDEPEESQVGDLWVDPDSDPTNIIEAIIGAQGEPGPPGPPGPTSRIEGEVDDPSLLPPITETTGYYLVGPDLILYYPSGGVWVESGSLRGPAGGSTYVQSSPPSNVEVGDTWWNPDEPPTPVSGGSDAFVSETAPSSPSSGLIWLDTSPV